MAGKKRIGQTLASQTAHGLKALAGHVKPIAKSATAVAAHGVHTARTWSAPRVERTGQVLQDSVAPKVASVLSGAAHRIEPARSRHARWRRPAGIATATAAASAATAVVLRRRKPGAASSPAQQDGVVPADDEPEIGATTSRGVDGQVGAS